MTTTTTITQPSRTVPRPSEGQEIREQGDFNVDDIDDLVSSRIASGDQLIDMSLGEDRLASEAQSIEDTGASRAFGDDDVADSLGFDDMDDLF